MTQQTEPGWRTWVFQGTVAEDATAGTHITSLTVTPGAGNEIEPLYGSIVVGATATAQLISVQFTDGTNVLMTPAGAFSTTTSGGTFAFGEDLGTNQNLTGVIPLPKLPLVSGTMVLKLVVQTTAISVTQTFAVVARIRAKPTATLADTIGVPTLTTNTNAVF